MPSIGPSIASSVITSASNSDIPTYVPFLQRIYSPTLEESETPSIVLSNDTKDS